MFIPYLCFVGTQLLIQHRIKMIHRTYPFLDYISPIFQNKIKLQNLKYAKEKSVYTPVHMFNNKCMGRSYSVSFPEIFFRREIHSRVARWRWPVCYTGSILNSYRHSDRLKTFSTNPLKTSVENVKMCVSCLPRLVQLLLRLAAVCWRQQI